MARLYVVPTPIGNLEDMTFRAVRVLCEASLILAEDTRHTRKLLTHYKISTRLQSYHQHNKVMRLDSILARLREEDVALVSDAGTPAVSDPGYELVRAAIGAGIEVEVLPGPTALITAVVAAALPAPGFLFTGFLPRKSGDRRRRLQEIGRLPYTIVMYEAPHRVVSTLRDTLAILGDRPAVVARELTKVHQDVVRSTLAGLLDRYSREEPRGEFTLVVGCAEIGEQDRTAEALDDLRQRRLRGESGRTAVDEVA
ncbi:MAG: 16S rRNA (cytidine(1402)-2'-O)-methyltransferase, partial [Chloroflexota bacterium]|nr:16S rRNA (cytidine(1402)-2'-O)-methyltransferase [Chloroflexota bacterium]